jgi:tubulin-folding cofactor B
MHAAGRWTLHIVDTNPNSLSARGWLEDTSKVQKYVISEADYEARENTYRKYKQQKLKVSPAAVDD